MATTDASALLKERYPESAFSAVPESAIVQKAIGLFKKALVGKKFVLPVRLTAESGFTYAKLSDGGITLQEAGPAVTADAEIDPGQIYELVQVNYADISRAPSGGAQAVEGANDWALKGGLLSMRRRVETNLINGGTALGHVQSIATVGSDRVLTIVTGDFAPGIWVGAEANTPVNAFEEDGTPINVDAVLLVKGVNSLTRAVTVSGDASDLTALSTYVAANPGDCQIWYQTAFNGTTIKESLGLAAIAANATTLFGINGAVYSLYHGNEQDVGGALTKEAVDAGLSMAVDKGLDMPGVLLISNRSWGSLSAELASVRRLDGSYLKSKGIVGQKAISIVSQNGELEVMPSNFVREGEAYFFAPEECMRIGSRDVALGLPNMDEVVYPVPGTNYAQAGLMTDQALFTMTPAHMVKFTGIVNS